MSWINDQAAVAQVTTPQCGLSRINLPRPYRSVPPLSVSIPPPPPNSLCLNVSLVVGIFSFLPYFLIASSPLILRSQTSPDSSCITMREYQNLQFLSYFHSGKEKTNRVWSHFVGLEHKSSASPSRCPGTFGGDIITDLVQGFLLCQLK